MKVFVVVSIYQGVLDSVKVFKKKYDALNYQEDCIKESYGSYKKYVEVLKHGEPKEEFYLTETLIE